MYYDIVFMPYHHEPICLNDLPRLLIVPAY